MWTKLLGKILVENISFLCLIIVSEAAVGVLTEAANQKKRLLWEIPDTVRETNRTFCP